MCMCIVLYLYVDDVSRPSMYALSFVGPTYSNTYRVMLKLCTYPEIFC